MTQPPIGNWLDATVMDDDTLQAILLLAYEYLEQYGRKMTATELRAGLRGPARRKASWTPG